MWFVSSLLKNTVRADPSIPGAARPYSVHPERRARQRTESKGQDERNSSASHGVEACKPLIGLRRVFRLRFPKSILSLAKGSARTVFFNSLLAHREIRAWSHGDSAPLSAHGFKTVRDTTTAMLNCNRFAGHAREARACAQTPGHQKRSRRCHGALVDRKRTR